MRQLQDSCASPFRSTCKSSTSGREPRLRTERLWQDYFTDPFQWWDNRINKKKPEAPDFRHKSTNQPLWIDGWYNPTWVKYMLEIKEGSQRIKGAKSFRGHSTQEQAYSYLENPGVVEELEQSSHFCKASLFPGAQLGPHKAQQHPEAELPPIDSLICILQNCRKKKNLVHAKRVHAQIYNNGLESHRAVGNYIVPMFVECGSLSDAHQVFDRLVYRNEHSWTSLILGYIECGKSQHALHLYRKMQDDCVHPSCYTLMALLKACAKLRDVERGREIHFDILHKGFETDVFVGNTLVDMYAKCGYLADAQKAFDKLPVQDTVSWNALIAGYAEHGLGEDALNCFERMQLEGIPLDAVTFLCTLKGCGSIGAIDKARELHADIARKGFDREAFIGNTLVDTYAKCCSLEEAHEVFDKLPVRDIVSWTSLIAGYAEHGSAQEALRCFEEMQLEGVVPDPVTCICALKACGTIGAIEKGRVIHADIAHKKGHERDVFVGCALVDMYAKCGSLPEAQEIFDTLSVRNVVSWNALIAGYAEHGSGQGALKCFEQMQIEGVSPDAVTFVCILKEMYAKYGSFAEARELFDKLPIRHVEAWNCLIAGYAEHGPGQEALRCFEQMQLEGLSPDTVTLTCVLKACGNIGAIESGREIHTDITQSGFPRDLSIGNTLVDMYAKCGSLSEAREVFDKLAARDVVSWNAMIKGYGMNHEGDMAVQCFEEMQAQCVKPDDITFTCLLTACSRARLVFKGWQFFNMMREEYGIAPTIDHYTCMVDLLAQSGHLYEAERFIETMPCPPSWTALLSGCKIYGDAELGQRCFKELVQMNPDCAAPYVLMAKIYASTGRWDAAYKLEKMRKQAGAKKKPASALIEVNKKVHEFVLGSSQSKEVLEMLEILSSRMKDEGHVPSVNLVVTHVSDEEKEATLCEHVEKMALAFGLLNTPQGQTLRVTKNLRMCNDCHNTSKMISKIEKRDIIIRDVYHVHHFKNGLCSCGDVF